MDAELLNEIREYALESIEYDFMSFIELRGAVYSSTNPPNNSLTFTADVAAELIREGTIVPGDVDMSGFKPWIGSPAENALKVQDEVHQFIKTGKDLLPGHICWFIGSSELEAEWTQKRIAEHANDNYYLYPWLGPEPSVYLHPDSPPVMATNIGRVPAYPTKLPVREVRSLDEITLIFNKLTEGYVNADQFGYMGIKGVSLRGTTIGFRLTSPTDPIPCLDINSPNALPFKVYVNEEGWPPADEVAPYTFLADSQLRDKPFIEMEKPLFPISADPAPPLDPAMRDSICDYVIDGLSRDWFDFADIPAIVYTHTHDHTFELQHAGHVAAYLISEGLVTPGYLGTKNLEPWTGTIEEHIKRIEDEIASAIRSLTPPNLTGICWLEATPKLKATFSQN